MSKLADARTRLYDAYRAVLDPLIGAGRVSRTTPAQIIAPCVYLESPRLAIAPTGNNSAVLVATFPVVCIVDGAQEAQTVGIDDIVAIVWDASMVEAGGPTNATPTPLDVGGPTLRAITVEVDVTLRGRTLCKPDQSNTTLNHEVSV